MKKGFTLIELLVVVLIIGILSSIALPQYTASVEKARATEAVSMLGAIREAAERYSMQNAEFPADGNFVPLDIDIADVNSSTPGLQTKYFTLGSTRVCKDNVCDKGYVVRAERSGKYTISVGVNEDGLSKRYCGNGPVVLTAEGAFPETLADACQANSECEKLCGAITNGHSSDGNW